MSQPNIVIESISPNNRLPEQATRGDVGYDLRWAAPHAMRYVLYRGATRLFSTGFRIALPDGYFGLVCSRSGLALHHSVAVLNAPGIIDPGYRGELQVMLHNFSQTDSYPVTAGDKIAQLIILPVVTGIRFHWGKVLTEETQRGEGGFGSTGQ